MEAKVLRFLVARYAAAAQFTARQDAPAWIPLAVLEAQIAPELVPQDRLVERQITEEERVESRIEAALLPLNRRETLRKIAIARDQARAEESADVALQHAMRNTETLMHQAMLRRQRNQEMREHQREIRRHKRVLRGRI